MSKLQSRLLVFFLGLPAIAALIVLLPYARHLGLNIAITLVLVVGCDELIGLFRHRSHAVHRRVVVPLSVAAPVSTYLHVIGLIGDAAYAGCLLAPFFLVALWHTLRPHGTTFADVLPGVAADFAALLYPGYFGLFLIRLAAQPDPVYVYLAFFSMVFANDTSAYVFGMLFGRSTRGVSDVSPNKSVPGFVAGPTFSVLVAYLFDLVRPGLFGDYPLMPLLIGAAVGAATVAGDLFESALKRSAGVKDSGIVVPGRGGVLDSVDSVIFAAPVFFYLLQLLP